MGRILRSQANDVLKAIQDAGLEPAQFTWIERPSGIQTPPGEPISSLLHRETEFFFRFDQTDDGAHYAFYSPGEQREFEERDPGTWPGQLHVVKEWLSLLRREVQAPDLWAAIGAHAAMVRSATASNHDSNPPFATDERVRIAAAMGEVRDYMTATYDLTADQAAELSRKLDYLIDASARLGRRDWINLALGVLINVAVATAFSPSAAKGLLQFVVTVLRWLVENPPLHLP